MPLSSYFIAITYIALSGCHHKERSKSTGDNGDMGMRVIVTAVNQTRDEVYGHAWDHSETPTHS